MQTLILNKDNYSKLRASYQEGADAQSYLKLVQSFGVKFFPRIPQEIIDNEALCKKLISLDSSALMYLPEKRQTEEYLFCVEKNHEILFMGKLANKLTANLINWVLDVTPSAVNLHFFSKPQAVFFTCDEKQREQLCQKVALTMLIKGREVPSHLTSYAKHFEGKQLSQLTQMRETMRLYQQLEITVTPKKKEKEQKIKV